MPTHRLGLLIGLTLASTLVAERARAVLGGATTTGDPAVVALVAVPVTCGAPRAEVHCTGTLVAPRVVLTAAHCLRTAPPSGLRVFVGADVNGPGTFLPVHEERLHPDWDGTRNDIGLLILERDAPVAPVRLATRAPAAGAIARVVGFGREGAGATGVKRTGTSAIDRVEATTFSTRAAPAMTCSGDSGGPLFATIDGAEVLAGVTSFGDPDCRVGTNTRVDAYASFVMVRDLTPLGDRAAIDPAAPFCAQRCADDRGCPSSMKCTDGHCALSGYPPGQFGAACDSRGGCGEARCIAVPGHGCRCYQECGGPAPEPRGGCAMGSRAASGWLILLAMLSLRRARWLLLLASCSRRAPSGPCPEGAHLASTPTQQACVLDSNPVVKHGPFVEWYEPGKKRREGAFANGRPDGKWTSWYRSGRREREVVYRDGVLDGPSVELHDHDKGATKESGEYRGGLRVGVWTLFHENGAREREMEYRADGTQAWTVWTPSGQKVMTGVFARGRKNGVFVEYHPNGGKLSEGAYKDSVKDGKWSYFAVDGHEQGTEEWRDGKVVASTGTPIASETKLGEPTAATAP